jgi:hypothetical protein
METTRHVRAVRHIQAGLCALVIFFVLGTPPAGAAEGAAKASSSLAQFPDRVELVRPIFGSDGLPLSGRHDVTLTYFDKAGIGLYAESLPAVDVTDGQLRVALGSGKTVMAEEYQSLQAVFAAHPEVDLEISVDGHVQSPRIGSVTMTMMSNTGSITRRSVAPPLPRRQH